MSEKAYVEFYEKYLPSPAGAATVSKLKTAKNEEEYAGLVVEAGRAAGYDFNADDARKVMKASQAKLQTSGELSDTQLEEAVGGAGQTASGMTVNLGSSLGFNTISPTAKLPNFDAGAVSTVMCPW